MRPKNLPAFFKKLNDQNITYSLLRWFDDLPNWPGGEDIDLLVKDSDLKAANKFFGHFPKSQAVDLYSETAVSSWDGLPYYPPKLAREILETRVRFKEDFYIPDPERFFLSFLYHVTYHKAEASGLPFSNSEGPAITSAEHDYQKIIANMNTPDDFDSSKVSFLYLHEYLKNRGWSPEVDTLRKRAEKREWLKRILEPQMIREDGQLSVFVVRERTLNDDKEILNAFFDRRYFLFSILEKIVLNDDEKSKATEMIRGGEWGKGPFPISGGPPAELWVAFDYSPQKPSAELQNRHPYLTNQNVYVKDTLRDEINRNTFWWKRYNPLHSSDDELEAWHYIKSTLDRDKVKFIETKVQKAREQFFSHNRLSEIGTFYSRAKVEIIEFNGRKAVRKTFKASMERFAQRERFAHTVLAEECDYIPKALDSGENYVVLPYLEEPNYSESERRAKLRDHADDIRNFIRFLYKKGYFISDFHPNNVLITEDGISIVDFEFLQRYQLKPPSPEKSYELEGIPRNIDCDRPRGFRGKGHTLRSTWQGVLD